MCIENMFDFLTKDYNMTYRYQEFSNCYGNRCTVHTHSYFNDTGCFTIYIEIQRGMEFWYASRFSTERKELCERGIDVSSIEPQVWSKYERLCFFKNPFFWWSDKRVLSTLAEAVKVHLAKDNSIFGIQVNRKTISENA